MKPSRRRRIRRNQRRNTTAVSTVKRIIRNAIVPYYFTPKRRKSAISIKRNKKPSLYVNKPKPLPKSELKALAEYGKSYKAIDAPKVRSQDRASKSCKPKPYNNKKSGSGPTRPFIPWCDRRR